MEYRQGMYAGKKVTIMGLGLLGRALGDARFFAEEGAEVVVTDLKSAEELKSSLDELRDFSTISYSLGGHKLEDFRGRDLIVKNAGVPLDSPFVEEARKHGIPVEMDASLFDKLRPDAIIIGVTGTRGKSTTTTLLFEMLKSYFEPRGQRVWLGGNIRGTATLPLVREVKERDIVVMELDSWQLQGFGDAKISPHIAVFTNFMNDHLNYYKNNIERYFEDKAQIFAHQKQNDYLVSGEKVAHLIVAKYHGKLFHDPISVSPDAVPREWKLKIKGRHNLENIALAMRVAKIMNVPYEAIQKSVEAFGGVEGRLQFLRTVDGVEIYNDSNSTTPDAAIAGLAALAVKRNVVLIFGGADKSLDMSALFTAKTTGSDLIKKDFDKLPASVTREVAPDLESALAAARAHARPGDVILFSPGFASFGMFQNEYDRGDQFAKVVKSI